MWRHLENRQPVTAAIYNFCALLFYSIDCYSPARIELINKQSWEYICRSAIFAVKPQVGGGGFNLSSLLHKSIFSYSLKASALLLFSHRCCVVALTETVIANWVWFVSVYFHKFCRCSFVLLPIIDFSRQQHHLWVKFHQFYYWLADKVLDVLFHLKLVCSSLVFIYKKNRYHFCSAECPAKNISFVANGGLNFLFVNLYAKVATAFYQDIPFYKKLFSYFSFVKRKS